ncbi:PQQ-dependent sugar dehydrogenase, partial [bacterium]|nr:PQQ-dependent sugar dehydrogenase [bacterium]
MRNLISVLFILSSPFASAKAPADEYFKVETVAGGFVDAMEMAVTPEGHVFVIERTGAVKLVNPENGKVKGIATIPVEVRKKEFARECGLLGITLDPNYEKNKWVYLYYSAQGKPVHHLARFTFKGDQLGAEK